MSGYISTICSHNVVCLGFISYDVCKTAITFIHQRMLKLWFSKIKTENPEIFTMHIREYGRQNRFLCQAFLISLMKMSKAAVFHFHLQSYIFFGYHKYFQESFFLKKKEK